MNSNIAIAGGGIAGLTLALLLAKHGMSVIVIEKNDLSHLQNLEIGNRSAALMNPSISILEHAGINVSEIENSSPFDKIILVDAPDNRKKQQNGITTSFYSENAGFNRFGINVPNNALQRVLFDRANENSGITLLSSSSVEEFTTHDHGITINVKNSKDNKTISVNASLLVGADGASSSVRKLSAIKCREKSYAQTAIACLINHKLPHNNTAWEIQRSGGPFAIVPLENNISSVVWVEKSKDIESIKSASLAEKEQMLNDICKSHIGSCKIECEPDYYNLRQIKSRRLIAKRVALVAEATHVMSPIGAQGLNLSLRDIYVLSEILSENHGYGIDIGLSYCLESYERKRFADINSCMFAVDLFNNIVKSDNIIVKNFRKQSLTLLDKSEKLKNIMIKKGLKQNITTS